MSTPNRLLYSIGVGLAVTLISGAAYWCYKRLRRDVMPQKWRRVGILDAVNLFPIKSCAPLKLTPDEVFKCEILGLRIKGFRDRALMLIDEKDAMVSARGYPTLVLAETEAISDTKLLIKAPDMEDLVLDFASLTTKGPMNVVRTAVCGSKVVGMLCGDKYDRWFSKFALHKESGFRLIYYHHLLPTRPIDSAMTIQPFIKLADTGTFGDATSYMLMNLSSIDDLNTRLDSAVDPLQFRGNFHLRMDDVAPYAEDNWDWIRIGDEAVFRNVAPCMRCISPNVNVYTGERHPKMEPLRTLNSYRKGTQYKSGVLGIHLGLRQEGSIKRHDIVYIGEP